MNILLIEDERTLALPIMRMLNQDGYRVGWQADGAAGLQAALTGEYDLIILDLLLPKKNGWEICRELRSADANIPVLILSALDEPSDKVRGLNSGADDFLAKPFDNDELLARVRALLRKDMIHRGQQIRVADLQIDRDFQSVKRGSIKIELTRSEFDLLVKLATQEGKLLKTEALAETVSLPASQVGDPLESCMASLRAKIDGPFPSPLIYAADRGYLLCAAGN